MSTTGVIARDLDIPLSTVSETCRRLAGAERIDNLGWGKWGALSASKQEEVAA
jgi:hypothetical protein